MTAGAPAGARRVRPAIVLAALGAVVVLVALLTPERTMDGGLRSDATGPGGSALAFELARRAGWQVRQRTAPLAPARDAGDVQVVIAPSSAIGARETHALLEDVRAGGGLLLAVDDGNEVLDSLGLALRGQERWGPTVSAGECPPRRTFADIVVPPVIHELRWRRPPPGAVQPLVLSWTLPEDRRAIGIGVPFGRGRIAVLAGADVFRNDVVGDCRMGADVAVMSVLEYLRNARRARLVVDEYHHGAGLHPGSAGAVTRYLTATPSGRALLAALAAGVLLVLARAPRPILPRDPVRVIRRSPLEHAEALGDAYADVGATRTLARRLVAGVRRRAGRVVPLAGDASDETFLAAAAHRTPAAAAAVDRLRHALDAPVAPREVAELGAAARDLEAHLGAPIP